jgi:hypothetical protein
MGDLMLITMGAGTVMSTVINSTKGVEDSCDNWQKSLDQYNDTKQSWDKVLQKQGKIDDEIKDYTQKLATLQNNFKMANKLSEKNFIAKRNQIIITMAVSIFSIIIILLLRKFNVYKNIWNLITGKK